MKQAKVQTFATYFASEITNMGNLVETGTLNAGYFIGFGNMRHRSSSTFDTTGNVSVGALTTGGSVNIGQSYSVVFEGSTNDSILKQL